MTTDLIAEFLTRMKNAGQAGLDTFVVPSTKMNKAISDLLVKQNFVSGVEEKEIEGHLNLVVFVAYNENNTPVVKGAKRVSKSSRRQYKKAADITGVKQGFGISVISTPKGIMTGDDAKKENVGGEVLFEIW